MRRAVAVLAALTALGAGAPAANADHVVPSVTATLTLGKAARVCNTEGVCARGRRATISWSAICGPAAPADALKEVDVGIYGVRPNGTTFAYDGEALEADDATLSGSMRMTAGPGLRFLGEVEVTCTATVVDEEGHEVEHTAKASGPTQQFYLPPQLVSARTTSSSFCGVSVPRSKVDRWLQARQYAELAYTLAYSAASLIKPGRAELKQIKLFARGDGYRLRSAPDRGMLRELGEIGRWVNPRRAGTMKVWATIAGHRTNPLRLRILPKRC